MPGTYFHVAPESAWASIVEHGLDHAKGVSAYAGTSLRYPSGNYLFADAGAAYEYAAIREDEEVAEFGDPQRYAVFEVTYTGPLTQDPFHDDESGLGASAVYTTEPIPANHVRRIS